MAWSTVTNHGTTTGQSYRCSHLGRTCNMGRLGMAQLDTTAPGTVEFGDEMFACRICLGFRFRRIGNWFRDIRAVHKRLSVPRPNPSSHLSLGVPLGILGLDRRTIRSRQQNSTSMEGARPIDASLTNVARASNGRVRIKPARHLRSDLKTDAI
jgi:hypothetical protein